ncbi:ciliary microtubule associated protein 1A-like [Onthophagus taurus]|uniref:ciliary microtubule associated protein 1A-like n=1 Tax=Onthophagus taurus TaxID=166361 RepID=UPI000C202C21|nr:outer dense fiber protein 3-like [Onthophagus taurus]
MPKNIGPGPGAYMLPPTVGYPHHDASRYRNPEYSMGIRLGGNKQAIGPGPKYEISKVTKYGKITDPAYSIGMKLKTQGAFKPPGPGAYSPELCPRMKEPRPPAYSIAARTKGFQPFNTPGANQYPLPSTLGPKVPNLRASAAYTIAGKFGFKGSEQSPGPARYGETRATIYKPAPPRYTMGVKTQAVVKPCGPGPAAYLPKLGRCTLAPGFSFGHRTSNDPYITAGDDMPCKN